MQRRIAKKWVLVYLASVLAFFGILEGLYRALPDPGNRVQRKIRELERKTDSHSRNLLFGTSVTLGALGRSVHKYAGTLNIATVNAVTFAGYYFMLERYLSKENSVDNVYVFFIPETLGQNLSPENKQRLEYFNTVFTRPEEIAEILRADKNYLVVEGKSPLELRALFWKRLKERLFFLHRERERKADLDKLRRRRFENLSRARVVSEKLIAERTERPFRLSPETVHFVQRLKELTARRGITLHFVLEPLQKKVYSAVSGAEFLGEFKELVGDEFLLAVNDIQDFPDGAFFDHLHLKGDWAKLYEKLIFSEIVKR